MLQPQGSRRLDPHRILQLHPLAPRALITEAYWELVERAHLVGSGHAQSQIVELNAAYRLLMDAERHRTHDEEAVAPEPITPPQAPAEKGGRVFFGRRLWGKLPATQPAAPVDHYAVLRVHSEADEVMIQLAYAHLLLANSSTRPDHVLLRHAIEEAGRVLRDPALRSQYDEEIRRASASSEVDPAQDPPQPQTAISVPPRGPLPTAQPQTLTLTLRAALQSVAGSTSDLATAVTASILDANEQPSRSAGALASTRAATTDAVAPRPDVDATRREQGVHRRKDAAVRTLEAAAQVRLRALRDEADASARTLRTGRDEADASARTPRTAGPNEQRPLNMQLNVVSGPQIGERQLLGDYTVGISGDGPGGSLTLSDNDSGDEPGYGRVWKHGDRFMFRQAWGAAVLVNGAPLPWPIITLEAGDEMQFGQHHLRFESAPEAAALESAPAATPPASVMTSAADDAIPGGDSRTPARSVGHPAAVEGDRTARETPSSPPGDEPVRRLTVEDESVPIAIGDTWVPARHRGEAEAQVRGEPSAHDADPDRPRARGPSPVVAPTLADAARAGSAGELDKSDAKHAGRRSEGSAGDTGATSAERGKDAQAGLFRRLVARAVSRDPGSAAARSQDSHAVLDARHALLVSLRDAPPAREPSMSAPQTAQHTIATLTFVAGAMSGKQVALDGDVCSVGSAPEAGIALPPSDGVGGEHVRLWRYRNHFVLRQAAGAHTTVNDAPLVLDLIVLDDGDEIGIGPHRIRFTDLDAYATQVLG